MFEAAQVYAPKRGLSFLLLINKNTIPPPEHNFVRITWVMMSACKGVKRWANAHSKESAQKIIEAMRIHYNYCRVHSQLGKTPAEQAGSKLELGSNKVESLIRMASKPAN